MSDAYVSAVCPVTHERRHFLPGLIRCFQAQRVPFATELLILDEGPEKGSAGVLDSLPENILYSRIADRPARMMVGEKRNILNDATHGEIIIHFDSDDWYHQDRIALQVQFLLKSGKQVTGFHDLFYFRVQDRSFWKYHFQGLPCVYASGTSLCYFRSWWAKHPFKKKIVGEDSEFAFEARDNGELASIPDPGLIVVRAHGQNTYTPQFGQAPFLACERRLFPKEFFAEEGA